MLDIDHLSQMDVDIISLSTKEVMDKYQLGKQPVYDRRFALNKKIKASGLSIEQIIQAAVEPSEKTENAKDPKSGNRGRPPGVTTEAVEEVKDKATDVPTIQNQRSEITRPIEISFENLTVRINGLPKKISVNSETRSLEIDV